MVEKRETKKPDRATRSRTDTIEVTPAKVKAWVRPPFQRPLKVTPKVREVADKIRADGGVVPGMIHLGHLPNDNTTYLIDGQHRREAFLISGCPSGLADVREVWFPGMADMGEEFVRLNGSIVRINSDDVLRGLEQSSVPLTNIREACSFVGYDQIRRGATSPVVSMSCAIRSWEGARKDIPSAAVGSAPSVVAGMTVESADTLINFLTLCFRGWGRDPEYWKLWGNLNLCLCAWLYQRTVTAQHSTKTPKLPRDLFGKCLMSLTSASVYLDWLPRHVLGDRDRAPAYNKIKAVFAKRIQDETGKKPMLPAPEWAHG